MDLQFCKNLKDARLANAFTQKQVATFLNIAESSYANWELGRTEPSIRDLRKLCQILDTPSDCLLDLERDDGTKIAVQSHKIEAKEQKILTKKEDSDEEKEIFTTVKRLNKNNKIKLLGFSKGLLESQIE